MWKLDCVALCHFFVCSVCIKYSTEPEITQVMGPVRLKAIMPRSDSEDDSSKRKLIYDGSKGKWSVFNQEVTVHTMSSEVQAALWNGEAVEIGAQDQRLKRV